MPPFPRLPVLSVDLIPGFASRQMGVASRVHTAIQIPRNFLRTPPGYSGLLHLPYMSSPKSDHRTGGNNCMPANEALCLCLLLSLMYAGIFRLATPASSDGLTML